MLFLPISLIRERSRNTQSTEALMDLTGMVESSGQMGNVQIAMLKKAQDLEGAAATKLIAQLPEANAPGVGGNIDVRA
jgi:hypothetical protein